MCGFVALFEPQRVFSLQLLQGAERDIYHRGPDSGGIVSEPGFALVFRRLAIMDPTHGADQPMTDPSGRYTIVFNGEIFNFMDLRKALVAEGALFRTSSDTEVILQGYIHWGDRVLERLEGMFAFAVVDRESARVLIARDPYGIKPLYMFRRGSGTFFSSEMRVLTRLIEPEVDKSALAELLTFGWAAGRKSNLKGIDRVPGGTALTVCLHTGKIQERRFIDILDLLHEETAMSRQEALERVSRGLKESVRAHLMSDVGFTIQLSGGVDSSLVAVLASLQSDRPLASFAVHLGDHPLDEERYRREVVRRCRLEHHEVPLGNREFADAMPQAVWHMEGPLPHLGCVMLMLLCRELRKISKVVLTGEGADEMFGGYDRYASWRKLCVQEKLSRLLPVSLLPKRRPFLGIQRLCGVDGAAYASIYRDQRFLHGLLPELIPDPGAREEASAAFKDFRKRLFAVDQTAYLESLLVRQDKMSMAASVEARVPYVHMPLSRILNTIPRNLMAPGGITKPILKEVAEQYLPRDILYRRKNGLLLPYGDWLQDNQGVGRYLDDLTQSDCRLGEYCSRGNLQKVVDRFRSGETSLASWLMRLINVEIWLKTADCLSRPNG